MKRNALIFSGDHSVEIHEEELPPVRDGHVRVKTMLSAISPGTELLVYRNQIPYNLPVDSIITALPNNFAYPLKYGYACIGRVVDAGRGVPADWEGRLVFAFNPHETYFDGRVDDVVPLPDDLTPEDSVFLPNMETAVNFLLDSQPIIGERVVVFGQGIVGLLTTALLAMTPLALLLTLDRYPLRRILSLRMGAQVALDADAPGVIEDCSRLLHSDGSRAGTDLCYELTGSPQVLNDAIAVTGFDGRIVIGSWYGQKRAEVDLGGWFHRSRIRLISSQVSTVTPELSGRWDKKRRFDLAWEMIRRIRPARLVTHTYSLERAEEAYALLDHNPQESVQVVFKYE